ncbi:kelch-like protein 31 isoform X2 [Diadema setosum]|uniref:kelch-like protein 31 isoform X2 n=1 Tax=Diadema setosum TaxID=31175 RepID=UPI003B3A4081
MNGSKLTNKTKVQSRGNLKHTGKEKSIQQSRAPHHSLNAMPPRVAKKTPHRVERKKKETGRPATTGLIPSSKPSRLSTVAETSNVNVRGSSLTDHASRVLGAATALWRRKKLHDVILAIGHHRAGAHRLVLAACSEYFCELFTSEEDDPNSDGEQFVYTLHGVSFETVKILLESMYTSCLHVTDGNIDEILNAALYLKIPTAIDSCSNYLLENLTFETCLRTLGVAISFDLHDVFENACTEVAKHFVDLSQTPEFLDLSEEPLICLISRDDLHIQDELQVFNACMQWLEEDIDGRSTYLVQLMRHIRLPMIKATEIVDFVESVPLIMGNPQCESLVKEALHYHCLPHRQSVLQSFRTVPRAARIVHTTVTTGGQPRHAKDPVSSDVMYYDILTKQWELLTVMDQPRHHHAAVALGGFLYVAGGRDTTCAGTPLRSACRYDPRINSWLPIADMINARESFQLCVLRDRIYAVERYDPCRDVWEPVASLSDPRRCVAVAAHSDLLYAVGGSGNHRISSKVECFDPDKNEWTSLRPLSTPRFFSLLIPFGDYLYLAGGATVESGGTLRCLEHVEQYDPSTDTWRTLAAMTTPRAEAAGCVVDGRMYMIGGYNWESKSWLNSAEEYDFNRDEWLAFTSFPRALTGVASCTLTLYKSPP